MAVLCRGLEDICRLCAIESESCLPIYSQEGETLNLEQKIISCLHIKVSRNDLLPKKVCGTCSGLLEELHQFSCRAANAQQTLNFLFDLQLRQLQEQELGILQNVKLEGSLIKNELDDATVHSSNGRVDTRHSETPDLSFNHLVVLPKDYRLASQSPVTLYRHHGTHKEKGDTSNSFESSNVNIILDSTVASEGDEPKQSHRRKMYQPKKAAERVDKQSEARSVIQPIELDQVCLLDSSSNDIHCLIDSATEVVEDSVHCLMGSAEVQSGEDSREVHCILDSATEEASVNGEVQCLGGNIGQGVQCLGGNVGEEGECLMDGSGDAGNETGDMMTAHNQDEDFNSVQFNEDELFEDLDNEEENKVEDCDNKQYVANNLALVRDWNITCDKCGEVYPRRPEFEAHYRSAHGSKLMYTCSLCGNSSPKFSSFRSHCYRHDSKFPCSYCDKVFTVEGMLRVHVLSRHVTERPFICEECGKGYVTQYRLNIHKKQHQTQGDGYRCTQCDKVLQTKNGLSSHMSAHRLGRRFMCDLCGKTFTQKVNMMQHVKFHKGERPFPCDLCNKRFAERSHLNRHRRFHSMERPFQCPVCQKMYKTERCLKVHSQVHQVTRPFVCSECGKGFLNITKLKQHYHCHTGERPYACKYCERTFTNYPNWLKHTRRRHKVDHKTGLKLEEGTPAADQTLPNSDPLPELDSFDISNVKIKADGGDTTLLLSPDSAQSLLTQFHEAADLAHFQLPDSQLLQY